METLEIHAVVQRRNAGGAWVRGKVAGHQFSALVFSEPADHPAWEVPGGSRISKLWLRQIDDGTVVYSWDRGEDIGPRNELAAQIVDLLAVGLADLVWMTWKQN